MKGTIASLLGWYTLLAIVARLHGDLSEKVGDHRQERFRKTISISFLITLTQLTQSIQVHVKHHRSARLNFHHLGSTCIQTSVFTPNLLVSSCTDLYSTLQKRWRWPFVPVTFTIYYFCFERFTWLLYFNVSQSQARNYAIWNKFQLSR